LNEVSERQKQSETEPSYTRHEAENAIQLNGNAFVSYDHPGYSGTGFVTNYYNNNNNPELVFNDYTPVSGARSVQLRYCQYTIKV
jgi:hypothetical protein